MIRSRWCPKLAYVIGLITTDGSLSKDKRHIIFTSKDYQLIITFAKILNLNNKIGLKKSGFTKITNCYQIQFGDTFFYKFLESLGLRPNKTRNIGSLDIPDIYYADFLRGHLDGDGYTYSYWDRRWKNSFMLYTGFTSASKDHIDWIKCKIKELYKIDGSLTKQGSVFRLLYAKKASLILHNKLYYQNNLPSLSRKKFKISRSLGIIKRTSRDAGIGRQATLRR